MGHAKAKLILSNPRFPDLPPIEVEALADTGATFLCIPESMAQDLRLDVLKQESATIADGSTRLVSYAGPIAMRFKNRAAYGGALLIGNQVLLGAIPMEDMDLIVHPRDRRVDVNPASPDIASCIVKAADL